LSFIVILYKVSHGVVYLASDKVEWITVTIFVGDGGASLI
jgi:hypothetical protein